MVRGDCERNWDPLKAVNAMRFGATNKYKLSGYSKLKRRNIVSRAECPQNITIETDSDLRSTVISTFDSITV